MSLLQRTSQADLAQIAPRQAGSASIARRAMAGHEPPDIVLNEAGMIQKCSRSIEMLFGYSGAELAERHISQLFPQLSAQALFRNGQFSPKLDFLCRCGHLFLAQDCRGRVFKSELSFVRMRTDGHRRLRLIIRPTADRDTPSLRK